MSQNGISGGPLPDGFPYKAIIEEVCGSTFFPCLVGAIKMNETGLGSGPTTEDDISGDGGHGVFQLTSSWPPSWQDPKANTQYALDHFLMPSYEFWTSPPYALSGDDLARAIAASYNAGFANAVAGHNEGDVGKYTTNSYDKRCLSKYKALVAGTIPE